MAKRYEKYIPEIKAPDLPEGLERKIMWSVRCLERRRLILKIFGFGVLLAGSLVCLVAGYFSLVSSLSQSGFFAMSSLFFSDFSLAVANFQDFSLSVIESFPVFSAAFLVAGLIATIWSAAHLTEDISEIKTYSLSG